MTTVDQKIAEAIDRLEDSNTIDPDERWDVVCLLKEAQAAAAATTAPHCSTEG